MNPRILTEALKSIEKCVDIPVTYFRAFTEPQVLVAINQYIRETNYTHYIMCGDDAIFTRKAVDCVLKYTEDESYDVFSGWMNMHIEPNGNFSRESTICLGWIPEWKSAEGPDREEYPEWQPMSWVANLPQDKVIRIAMANFAMTIAERELFLRFPLQTHRNDRASDHHWSYKLQRAGVKEYTHPDAFVKHLRRGWTPWRINWLVGKVESEIRYENMKWGSRENYV
jgi:hypothetical protein